MRDLRRWEGAPLEELIDHLIDAYHRPLAILLDRTGALAAAAVAGLAPAARARVVLAGELHAQLRELLVDHLQQEEVLVFPWLRSRERASAGVLVALLERDHDELARFAQELRGLVDPIAGASAATGALAAALAELDLALREQIHLENAILFPRALAYVPPAP